MANIIPKNTALFLISLVQKKAAFSNTALNPKTSKKTIRIIA